MQIMYAKIEQQAVFYRWVKFNQLGWAVLV